MNKNPPAILVIADAPLPDDVVAWIGNRYVGRRIIVLSAAPEGGSPTHPPAWEALPAVDLLDDAALRQDFLGFLESWPRQPLLGRATFDQLFRTRDGWSLWWTGPGAQRHPLRGPFPAMRVLWLNARALARLRVNEMVVCAREPRLAASLISQAAAARIKAECAPGFARSGGSPWRGRTRWLVGAIGWMVKYLLSALVRALAVRLLGGTGATAAGKRETATVVTTASFPRHVDSTERAATVWYWEAVARALARLPGGVRVRHLLHLDWQHIRRSGGLSRALLRLRPIRGRLPAPDVQVSPGSWCRNILGQLRLLFRYHRVESSAAFRQSFRFQGADVAALYVPCLREAVMRAIYWETRVDATVASLRAAGNVKAVLVHEEFYAHPGMIVLAACRRLAVPGIGVQHGTIYPMHLIYTPPPGQIAGAPTPDFFAAYGQFAQEVVSRHGVYPRERVRVCGGPRFDALVSDPPDQSACRQRLNLPADRFVLLVTTQGPAWFPAAVRALRDAARETNGLCLCIKCWNADTHLDSYRRLAAGSRPADIRVFTDGFDDLLGACDALASVSSTTVLEASLLGKPTVCLNFSGEPDRYPYVEEGVSIAARSPEEVRQAVVALKAFTPTPAWNERRRRFLERHLGPTVSGSAATALARFIQQEVLARGEAASTRVAA